VDGTLLALASAWFTYPVLCEVVAIVCDTVAFYASVNACARASV
jgi:hypothetical protein